MSCYLVQSTELHSFNSSVLSELWNLSSVFRSDCSGSGSPKLTCVLPASLVVLLVLGCHSILGALFWMRWAWTDVTFWLWCCHMSSDKSCLNKTRLWGGSDAYVHCAHLFWGKKLLQRYVWGGRRVKSVCLLWCQAFWKQNAAVLPTNPQVHKPFLLFYGTERWPHPFFLWRGNFLLHSESLALTPLTTEQSGSL